MTLTIREIADVLKEVDEFSEETYQRWENCLPQTSIIKKILGESGDGKIFYCGGLILEFKADADGELVEPVLITSNFSNTLEDELPLLPYVIQRVAKIHGLDDELNRGFRAMVSPVQDIDDFKHSCLSVIEAQKTLDKIAEGYTNDTVSTMIETYS